MKWNEIIKAATGVAKRPAVALSGIKRIRLSGERLKALGRYAALALLLCILGSASWAYRAHRDAVQRQAPQAAVAMRVPAATPTPLPTPRPAQQSWPLEGEIVGAYAPAEPVWSETLGLWQTHPALDIAGSPGEAVYACMDGSVEDAYSDRLWGNVIVLAHADGYRSVYAGLNTLALVKAGDAVDAGQIISAVGNSAACEANLSWHLHFELTKDGEPVDFEGMMAEETGNGGH